MDKFANEVQIDEILNLEAEGDLLLAAEIADTVDWTRIDKISLICHISDLYKRVRRYEDAIDLLQLAYGRSRGDKDIVYGLCLLYLKTGNQRAYLDTHREYINLAPSDWHRYILQYKIYEAQDISLEERIEVLEKLKSSYYHPRWAYELAFLYHRVGLATKCVEECDQLIMMFDNDLYVYKAMDLKALHTPLTQQQKLQYDRHNEGIYDEPEAVSVEQIMKAGIPEGGLVEVPGLGSEASAYESVEKAVPVDDLVVAPEKGVLAGDHSRYPLSPEEAKALAYGHTQVFHGLNVQEPEIKVKQVDVGEYNTMNLQMAIAEGVQEVMGQDEILDGQMNGPAEEEPTKVMNLEDIPEEVREQSQPALKNTVDAVTSVMTGGKKEAPKETVLETSVKNAEGLSPEATTKDIEGTFLGHTGEMVEITIENDAPKATVVQDTAKITDLSEVFKNQSGVVYPEGMTPGAIDVSARQQASAEDVYGQMAQEAMSAQPPEPIAEVLTQEADGQISFVIPEAVQRDKQITGQINISDAMIEWERIKREREENNRKQYEAYVKQQTGKMFSDFEKSVLEGVLEQIDKEEKPETVVLPDKSAENAEVTNPEGVVYPEGTPEIPQEDDQNSYTQEVYLEEGYSDEYYEGDTGYQDTSYEGDGYQEGAYEEGFYEEGTYEEGTYEDGSYLEEGTYEEGTYSEEGYEEYGLTDDNPEVAGYEEEATLAAEVADILATENEEEVPLKQEETPSVEEKKIEEQPISEAADSEIEYVDEKASDEKVSEEKVSDESVTDEGKTEKASAEGVAEGTNAKATQATETVSEDGIVAPRKLSNDEKQLFGPYIQSKKARVQLVNVLDNVSMAAYTGNVILMGDDGTDTITLATNIMKEMKQTDSNFSGKVAKITGEKLNTKVVKDIVTQLVSGALIIENASGMNEETANALYKALEQEKTGIVVAMTDSKKGIEKLLRRNPELEASFTARMQVEALSNDKLVAFAKHYAREREYSINSMGELALHTQIESRQSLTHAVNVLEVKELVDDAIERANRKTPKHFIDILIRKRYDEEDMIILGENDFPLSE